MCGRWRERGVWGGVGGECDVVLSSSVKIQPHGPPASLFKFTTVHLLADPAVDIHHHGLKASDLPLTPGRVLLLLMTGRALPAPTPGFRRGPAAQGWEAARREEG
jgi:hypothetical protein